MATRLQLNFETFGSIGAIIVSLAALFVAYDQSKVMRVQQHAAVIPILTVDMTIDQNADANIINLAITNVGVGPAMVLSAVPTLDDEPVLTLAQVQSRLFGDDLPSSMRLNASSATTVMGVGEVINVLGMQWERSTEGDAIVSNLAQGIGAGTLPTLSTELCYCSVFDRCWIAGRADMTYPEQTDQCTPSGDFLQTFFQNVVDEVTDTHDLAESEDTP